MSNRYQHLIYPPSRKYSPTTMLFANSKLGDMNLNLMIFFAIVLHQKFFETCRKTTKIQEIKQNFFSRYFEESRIYCEQQLYHSE
jgi:hypothetical protein